MSSLPEKRSSLFVLPAVSARPADGYVVQAAGSPPFEWEHVLLRSESGCVCRRDLGRPLADAVSRPLDASDTAFLTERQALESLSRHVLPALMARRRCSKKLKLWSAGCGTGRATYSLALALAELCPALSSWEVEIVASDADSAALTRARRGVYSSYDVQRGLPLEWLVRHFEQLPDGVGWRVNFALAGRITWLSPDALGNVRLPGSADIIFCHRPFGQRDAPTLRRDLEQVTSQMAADGYLILPAPEPALAREPGFERVAAGGAAVYQRIERERPLQGA